MTSQFKLDFDFYSFWRSGSGESGGSYADTLVIKDGGLPYLPAASFSGVLLKAFGLAHKAQWLGDDGKKIIETLFGKSGTKYSGYLDIRNGVLDQSEVDYFNSKPRNKSQLYRIIHNQAIDRQTSTTIKTSKRSSEVTIPLKLSMKISCRKDIHNKYDSSIIKQIDDNIETWLTQCCTLISVMNLGAKSNRGYGNVTISIASMEEATQTTNINHKENDKGLIRHYYLLETLDNTIQSYSPQTTQAHVSLDYISGTAILGAIASKHYKDCENSWNIFHNGTVKFSNGYIANEEDNKISRSLPIPLSWHIPKGETLSLKTIVNQLGKQDMQENNTTQMKQCRTGYIAANNKLTQVKKNAVTKNNKQDTELFTYSYIQKGTKFIGYVQCDEEKLKTNDVIKYLQSIDRIGKSRTKEFAAVKVDYLAAVNTNAEQNNIELKKDDELIIWLISDAQIVDDNNFPVMMPQAKDIQLDEDDFELIPQRCHLLHCQRTLFNRKRAGFESAQFLIRKGSILVYKVKKDIRLNTSDLETKGIGINQQQGLGDIIINSSWAKISKVDSTNNQTTRQFCFAKPIDSKQSRESSEDSKLIKFIKQCTFNNNQEKIDNAIEEIKKLYLSIKTYHQSDNVKGPSKNQWGELYQLTRSAQEKITDENISFKTIVLPQATDTNNWGLEFYYKKKNTTFSEQFIPIFTKLESIQEQRSLIEKIKSEILSEGDGHE